MKASRLVAVLFTVLPTVLSSADACVVTYNDTQKQPEVQPSHLLEGLTVSHSGRRGWRQPYVPPARQ